MTIENKVFKEPENTDVKSAERIPDAQLESFLLCLCSSRWNGGDVSAKVVDQQLGGQAPPAVLDDPVECSWSWRVEGAFSGTERVFFKLSSVVIGDTLVVKECVCLCNHFLYPWQTEDLLFLVLLSFPTSKRKTNVMPDSIFQGIASPTPEWLQ